jgi:branched-chain amino acid transport system ATP-binding protein
MLEVDNLSVRYGAISAVRGASLKVNSGEIVSLLGSNGAGKSSLVSAVVGIIPTAGGTVRFEGDDITRANAETVVARGMTLTPEGRRVFGDLSVHENLILGAATNRNRAQVRQDIEKYFDMFPILRERSQQLAKTLSGGEQQMLAIARSLMSRPRLLMLDEPSLGLAPRIVDGIFDLMVKLRDEGLTILVVEQNASEALSIADRAYIMTTGTVVYEGMAAELVGSDNLMDAYLGTSVGYGEG